MLLFLCFLCLLWKNDLIILQKTLSLHDNSNLLKQNNSMNKRFSLLAVVVSCLCLAAGAVGQVRSTVSLNFGWRFHAGHLEDGASTMLRGGWSMCRTISRRNSPGWLLLLTRRQTTTILLPTSGAGCRAGGLRKWGKRGIAIT